MFKGRISALDQDDRLIDPPGYPYIILDRKHYRDQLYEFLLLNVRTLVGYILWAVAGVGMGFALWFYANAWVLAIGLSMLGLAPLFGSLFAYLKSWRGYPHIKRD